MSITHKKVYGDEEKKLSSHTKKSVTLNKPKKKSKKSKKESKND